MNRLKGLRQAAGLSQAELAERAGISLRVLQNYEQGRNDIGRAALQTAVSLAKVLSVHAEELIGYPIQTDYDEKIEEEGVDYIMEGDNRVMRPAPDYGISKAYVRRLRMLEKRMQELEERITND